MHLLHDVCIIPASVFPVSAFSNQEILLKHIFKKIRLCSTIGTGLSFDLIFSDKNIGVAV